MTAIPQRSFVGGEITPSLGARVDQAKYAAGLKTCRNFIIQKYGGVSNRPATSFIANTKFPSRAVRLFPFIFNSDQTYVLEFGHQYMRVFRNGAVLTSSDKTITGVTKADPGVVTAVAHGFSDGDHVIISGVSGMTELNGRVFVVANKATDTFELTDLDGNDVDTSAYTAYSYGGTASKIYEIATPYGEDDLSELQFVQSADVVVIVHRSYAPRELVRTGHTTWTLSTITFGPGQAAPTNIAFSKGAAGSTMHRYRVTAYDPETLDESYVGSYAGIAILNIFNLNPCFIVAGSNSFVAGDEVYIDGVGGMTELNGGPYTVGSVMTASSKSISSATQANPCQITTTGVHGFSTGDIVQITGVVGMTELNGNYYKITVVDTTHFNLDGINSTGYSAYTSGGTVSRISGFTLASIDATGYGAYTSGGYVRRTGFLAAAPTASAPHVLSWTSASGTDRYNIYRELYGVYGYIGSVVGTTFPDTGADPDVSDTPPIERTIFESAGNYPGVAAYHQQRLLLASSDNEPETVWASKSGRFKNFTVSEQVQDDDAITFSMAGRQVNSIRHLLGLAQLVVLTAGGEWSVSGDSAGIIRPAEVNPKQHAFNGASTLPPVIANDTAIYAQARGTIVRDFGYDVNVDGYRGNDLTVFSAHLFRGHSLVDWAYQQAPNPILWAVREDGILLGLTYLREHELAAWHRHDLSGGVVENISIVPEGLEDAIYLVVRRTIDGATRRYVERMNTRDFDDVVDAVFVDSALSYDGRNTNTGHTMTLSGGSSWLHTESLTLTSSASFFAASDVGNAIHMTDANGDELRLEIVAFTSATVVTVRAHKTVPSDLRGVATSSWAKAVDELSGLWHLEGEEVSVLADGYVAASANNARYSTKTVENGSITLSRPHAVIHVGLPITADLETLDVDTPAGALAGEPKNITEVKTMLEDSRGLFVGGKPPTDDDDDPLEGLTELKVREFEDYGDPVALLTGTAKTVIDGSWNTNGRIFIRQVDPLPASILAVIPTGIVGRG